MTRPLVQALDGLSFPCDRTRIMEYAERNDISSRGMDSLQRLPEQQYASMAELLTLLPSKGSLRKARSKVGESRAEPQPKQMQETPTGAEAPQGEAAEADAEPEPEPQQPGLAVTAAAASQGEDRGQGSERDQEQPPMAAHEPVPQRSEPAPARMDPFGLVGQWQQLWLKSAENYTRLFMPWLTRTKR